MLEIMGRCLECGIGFGGVMWNIGNIRRKKYSEDGRREDGGICDIRFGI
jgi:hypothetical protein